MVQYDMDKNPKALWNKSTVDEVKFWEQYFATEGLQWKDEYRMRLDPQSTLQERLIIERLDAIPYNSISILDVGAGPLTVLGKKFPGKVLNITAVDPLADEYDRILKEANIVPPVRTMVCHGEQLLKKFKSKSFDFAYARNSLDHSYDPLLVIKNMLAVVKNNRFVLLRHKVNEAKNAYYQDLHEWNFDIKQNKLIIWNQSTEHDVTEMLCHNAQVECYYDGDWVICIVRKLGDTKRVEAEANNALTAKSLIKNTVKKLPYLRQVFLERDQLRVEISQLKSERDQLQRSWIAYEPDLIPPLNLMHQEGIQVLEEWLRWAEEWSMLLRVYGGITRQSAVLEVGCGLGRTAFPLRYILSSDGSYDGFDICRNKIEFLEQAFHKAYPNFRFIWADIHNTFYNSDGQIRASDYRFPYPNDSFDIVYAASVFTHMLPEATTNYFKEASRVLKPDGRCLFSFFLLDNYRPGQPRPLGFARPGFNFDHHYGHYGEDFAIAEPDNPEQMTAYRLRLIEFLAAQAGLELGQAPVPGIWSGSTPTWVGAQDLVVMRKH